MPIIELKEVIKRFGDNLVLDKASLKIPENSIFGIIGINGSGKTTILRLIVNYYKANAGKIFYEGKPLSKQLNKIKQEIGFTTQESSFYSKLTVEENIAYFGSLYGLSKAVIKTNMEKVLRLVELDYVRNKLAEHLSGGMQRRLDMACSLIHVPRILILDEPTEDLDPLLKKDILRLIKKIKEIGTTVIITSHLLEDLEIICDKIAILHNKKIIRSCSMEELRKEYTDDEEIHLQTCPGNYDLILKNLSRYDEYHIDNNKLMIKTPNAERTLHEIIHIIENTNEKLIYVDIQKPHLTEIFTQLTKTQKKGKFLER
tara:strand:- start:120 stop:1064 length:945 start_codon:yes stop_codon:yes gene_type:complete